MQIHAGDRSASELYVFFYLWQSTVKRSFKSEIQFRNLSKTHLAQVNTWHHSKYGSTHYSSHLLLICINQHQVAAGVHVFPSRCTGTHLDLVKNTNSELLITDLQWIAAYVPEHNKKKGWAVGNCLVVGCPPSQKLKWRLLFSFLFFILSAEPRKFVILLIEWARCTFGCVPFELESQNPSPQSQIS